MFVRTCTHARSGPYDSCLYCVRNCESAFYSWFDGLCLELAVPAGSPSRDGHVAVDVFDINPAQLARSFLFCSCIYFCLHGPFNCILFHKFSRQLSAFSLFSSGLISAIGSFNYTSLYESLLQPRDNPLWFAGPKALTNY